VRRPRRTEIARRRNWISRVLASRSLRSDRRAGGFTLEPQKDDPPACATGYPAPQAMIGDDRRGALPDLNVEAPPMGSRRHAEDRGAAHGRHRGFQDQHMASWGASNYMDFGRDGSHSSRRDDETPGDYRTLAALIGPVPLLLEYRHSAHSGTVHKSRGSAGWRRGGLRWDKTIQGLAQLAGLAKRALLKRDGELGLARTDE